MPNGTIRRLITGGGYGLITREEGQDLFFHRSDVKGMLFYMLREGQEVEFEVGPVLHGRPQAMKVRPVQPKGE